MIRLISFGATILVFIVWSLYKLFIDKKTTKRDIDDIKLGTLFVTIFAAVFYLLFIR